MKKIITALVLLFVVSLQVSVLADTTNMGDFIERNIILGSSHIEGKQKNNIYFGRYQQKNLGTTQPATGVEGTDYIKNDAATSYNYGPYYSIDPVKWRVLSASDEVILLFSDKLIESKRFHENYGYIYWDACTIRSWLNGYGADSNACGIDYTNNSFIGSVFSLKERELMTTTSVDGVTDVLYLLSSDEATNTNYGFVATNTSDGSNNRTAKYTDYHWGAGLGANWWLRSSPPMGYPCDKVYVYANNGYIKYGGASVYHSALGVRPAFRLKISDVLFTSGTASDGYALTFLDKNRSFALKDISEKNAYQGDKVSFEYIDSFVGNNEYISAMIVNSEGECMSYQKLVQPTSDSGTGLFDVPSDLKAGEYTVKFFNEQYNGEKKTSYSSDFVDVPLTVRNKPKFEILSCSTLEDKTIATISIPQSGSYNVIFADYEGEKLNDLDIVTITVTEDKVGEITQESEKEIVLGSGDRIMLWTDMTTLIPKCEAYIVK